MTRLDWKPVTFPNYGTCFTFHHEESQNISMVQVRPMTNSPLTIGDLITLTVSFKYNYFRNYKLSNNFSISPEYVILLHEPNNIFSALDTHSKIWVSPGDDINMAFTKKIMETVPTANEKCSPDESYSFRKCFNIRGKFVLHKKLNGRKL